MREISQCCLCGATDFQFLFNNHDRMYGTTGEFSLWKCTCGLIFINPQPQEEIIPYYPEIYEAYEPRTHHALLGAKFLKKLERIYDSLEDHFWEKILFLPFRPLIRGTLVKPEGRLLDFGCGSGDFLEKMKGLGMEVWGVDFSEIALRRARARGLNVLSLKESHFPDEYFDVITLNHVFEHLPDPLLSLMDLRRVLKRDGTLIINVPNIGSLGFKIFGRCWHALETPRHFFLYSLKTLRQCAEKSGFQEVRRTFQSFPAFSLISLDYWLNQFRKHQLLGMRSRLGGNLFLNFFLFPIATLLSWTPWGDCVEIWLKKDESLWKGD
ncbi:MAG: class I SAM-dependent methyltransferase [Chlamydiae bacterium]|nr:class I SAM-dependent methyltransferase [Chlamydiota bacterium]MBI3266644.1 class I SAM-dependent methyltransferase [Chlamydiota bacterium]